MRYEIIEHYTKRELETEVELRLKGGWTLLGGVSVSDIYGCKTYCQAMTITPNVF